MGVEPTMSDVCAKVGKRTHVGWYRTAPLRTGTSQGVQSNKTPRGTKSRIAQKR